MTDTPDTAKALPTDDLQTREQGLACKYVRAKEVIDSDMSAIAKLCAYPFAPDDQVVHRSELGTITVGDLRVLLARATLDGAGEKG